MRAITGGVILVTCLATGERHIEGSVRAQIRVSDILGTLRRGKHTARLLQARWDEYGPEQFSVEIIATCAPRDVEMLTVHHILCVRPALTPLPRSRFARAALVA